MQQSSMKLLLMTIILLHTIFITNPKKLDLENREKRQTKEKEFNLNFGLSTALKERLNPELIEKSLIGKYVSKEFFTLVLVPIMNEIERRITKLEKTDDHIEGIYDEKKKISTWHSWPYQFSAQLL